MNEHRKIVPKLRVVEDGEIISQPGIYAMSIDWYHSQCCDGPSISSSGIRAILKSPAHYWRTSELNPHRVEEEDKEAFVLGRAAHHLLLGEANFHQHFVVSVWPDFRTNVAKAWREEQLAEGKTVLTKAQVEKIRGMAGLLPWQAGMTNCGLKNTPLIASAGALSGEIERSLIFKIGDVWVKSRPDAIPEGSNDVTDLKTISSKGGDAVDDRSLSQAIERNKYFVQGAVVGMAMKEVLNRQMAGFHLAFVDTGDVHAVAVKTVDEQDIVRGERSVFTGIALFQRCLETGIWPGPTARQADALKIGIPQWSREQFDRQLDLIDQELAA